MIDGVTAALSLVQGAVTTGKGVIAAGQAVDQAELKLQMADLMGNLAQAMASLTEAQEQIAIQEQEIRRLTEALEMQGAMRICDSAYWKVDEREVIQAGPFCIRCWEADHNARSITDIPAPQPNMMRCQQCKSDYKRRKNIVVGEPMPPT